MNVRAKMSISSFTFLLWTVTYWKWQLCKSDWQSTASRNISHPPTAKQLHNQGKILVSPGYKQCEWTLLITRAGFTMLRFSTIHFAHFQVDECAGSFDKTTVVTLGLTLEASYLAICLSRQVCLKLSSTCLSPGILCVSECHFLSLSP